MTATRAPSLRLACIGLRGTTLGKAAQVMHELLAQPQAMPVTVLRRYALPVSLHAFDLNLLWLWEAPVRAFLNILRAYDQLRLTATTGRPEAYAQALSGLLQQPMLSALENLRAAFKSPPAASQIDRVGRIVLHDLCPSKHGLEADLATFQKAPIPCRLDLWLEELGWADLTQTAQERDRATSGLFHNLSGLTLGAIQREMQRIAA